MVLRLTCLLVGLGYVFLIPPFQAPDETHHFLKAWSVSQGHLILRPTADHRLGDTLPASLQTLCNHFRPSRDAGTHRWDAAGIREGLAIPLAQENRQFLDFANTAFYAPVAYLPAALSISFMRWLDAPPLGGLYLARLCHMLLWMIGLLLISRKAHRQRTLFLFLGCLPGVMVFQASLNPDAVVHAAAWVLIIQLVYGRARDRWRWSGPLLLFISLQKLILFPLGLVQPFRSDRRKMFLWLGVAILLAGIWGTWARHTFIPYQAYHPKYRMEQTLNPGVDPPAQLAFVCQQPMIFLGAAARGLVRSAPATLAHWLGKYGWEKHYLPDVVMLVLFMGLLVTCATTAGPSRRGNRLVLLGISAAVVMLFTGSNYLLWNAVGSSVLDNFQGRYFIPVLPIVFWAASGRLLKGRIWNKIPLLCLGIGHLSMIFLLWKSLFF